LLIKKKRPQRKNGKIIIKRAEAFVKDYRNKERDMYRMDRVEKRNNVKEYDTQHLIIFVLRIKSSRGITPKATQILKYFRLKKENHGVFVKLNAYKMKLLNLIEPFVTWGYPSQKSIRELITKRGYAFADGNRVALTDNKFIEDSFKNPDIICTEDIIHEILTCGKNFKQVNLFLCPFKLTGPRNGFQNKFVNYKDGGDNGNRGDKINDIINIMN